MASSGPRIRGVGAAAPSLRVTAADIGAAWGRGGRGQVAVCAPDEDTPWSAPIGRRRAAIVEHRPSLIVHAHQSWAGWEPAEPSVI